MSAKDLGQSVNELFLAIGLYRARQPPDKAHPLGHARERFLWAFMAAITSFLIGGCLSIALAIARLRSEHTVGSTLWAWIVLAVSFAADGTSWIQALRQARQQAKDYGVSVARYLSLASDPVVRAVFVEDSAALIGLTLAAAGLAVSQISGSGTADSIASLLIGVLLAVTAFALARPFADFLVGRSIPEGQLERLKASIDRAKREQHNYKHFFPDLPTGTWAAASGPLGLIVSNYELMADLSTFYGHVEELRWRLRFKADAATDDQRVEAAYLALLQRFVDATARHIEEEVAAGRVLPLDPVPTATALTWMMERYLQLELGRVASDPPVESVADTLATIWSRVLYGSR